VTAAPDPHDVMTYAQVIARMDRATLERIVRFAWGVLDWYADPDTYFAISVIADPPCGDFIRDHSLPTLQHHRHFPGRRARLAGEMIRNTLRAAGRAIDPFSDAGLLDAACRYVLLETLRADRVSPRDAEALVPAHAAQAMRVLVQSMLDDGALRLDDRLKLEPMPCDVQQPGHYTAPADGVACIELRGHPGHHRNDYGEEW